VPERVNTNAFVINHLSSIRLGPGKPGCLVGRPTRESHAAAGVSLKVSKGECRRDSSKSTTDSPRERRKKTPPTERRGIPKHLDEDSAKKLFRIFFLSHNRFTRSLAITKRSLLVPWRRVAWKQTMSEKTNAFPRIDECTALNPYERKM
jgi:hypothetical protein